MKTKEEIELLAAREYWRNNVERRSFIIGYTQCQQDMSDKKYTEEDMFEFAKWLLKINFNYTSNIIDIFQIWKEQLNKQD